jgi:hypothetical protein
MQKGGRGPYQPQLSPDKVRELQKMIDTERMGDPVHGVQKGIELFQKKFPLIPRTTLLGLIDNPSRREELPVDRIRHAGAGRKQVVDSSLLPHIGAQISLMKLDNRAVRLRGNLHFFFIYTTVARVLYIPPNPSIRAP